MWYFRASSLPGALGRAQRNGKISHVLTVCCPEGPGWHGEGCLELLQKLCPARSLPWHGRRDGGRVTGPPPFLLEEALDPGHPER